MFGDEVLDLTDSKVFYLVMYIFIPALQRAIDEYVQEWNDHTLNCKRQPPFVPAEVYRGNDLRTIEACGYQECGAPLDRDKFKAVVNEFSASHNLFGLPDAFVNWVQDKCKHDEVLQQFEMSLLDIRTVKPVYYRLWNLLQTENPHIPLTPQFHEIFTLNDLPK